MNYHEKYDGWHERFEESKRYLICIDSDGTVFNTQEMKFKKFVIPWMIRVFNLHEISPFVRETAEYVNLYSEHRGIGQYEALLEVFELLYARKEVKKMGIRSPDMQTLRKWIETEPKLCRSSLEEKIQETNDSFLIKVLEWDKMIDISASEGMREIPPFRYVRESMEKAFRYADIIVVSSESSSVLDREWEDSGLDPFVRIIAGREMGNKNTIIRRAIDGRYEADHVLMIGDALGDLAAAKSNSALFYPVNPGAENASWKRFFEEGFNKFIDGQYSESYEEFLVSEFRNLLKTSPSW